MLSATANLSCARPAESVTSSGCHTRVSGKYLRNLGVKVCCSAWTAPEDLLTDAAMAALVVSTATASAVTSTVIADAPTINLMSTVVRFDDVTGMELREAVWKPGAEEWTW